MGWAGWKPLGGSPRFGCERSAALLPGWHLPAPRPTPLLCGPAGGQPGLGSAGHFCAPALEVRGKDTQEQLLQGCWRAAERRRDRHGSQTEMGCSEHCCRAISFLQPHEKRTVTIKLPSALCSFSWLRCLICHEGQRCLISGGSSLDEGLQKSTWVSPQKGVAEACCGKHYAETLPSSPALRFCQGHAAFSPTAFHLGSEQTPVSGEAA